jgi:hypothetical protein
MGMSSCLRRLVARAFDRVESIRARAVAPAALAAAVRVPDRRRLAVPESAALAPRRVARPLAALLPSALPAPPLPAPPLPALLPP